MRSRADAYWTPEREHELTAGKDLPIVPSKAAALLRTIGLLRADATMPDVEVRKFLQLNHMIWLLGPPVRELISRGVALNIVDAGCGLAYLTASLAWCLKHEYRHEARIVGVDRREDLIESCRERAAQADLSEILHFECRAVNAFGFDSSFGNHFGDSNGARVILGLHACDTATDDAIELGLRASADLIAVAPCCQAELARRWRELDDGALEPIWSTPHLRREAAATVTDTMRGLLLEAAGYEVRTVEFVASEHTPKNTLIRAMKRTDPQARAWKRYLELKRATGGVGIGLEDVVGSLQI